MLLLGALLLLPASAALAESRVTWTPETPRAGDSVDVTVTPERESPQSVTYRLGGYRQGRMHLGGADSALEII